MKRVKLEDGRWFSPESAKMFEENTWFDGSNRVSVATGSQWNHEELYRTRSGSWVLHEWSQWQGAKATYRLVDDEEAKTWLIRNDHDPEPYFPGALAEREV